MNDKCPQCGSENAELMNDEGVIVCQCPDCGEETVTYPEFPEYSGF